uniref:Si:dkey-103i16.6 n=1 Tax=Sinocyclocheilus grahami TaxID=75366 RepID=A0A672R374_SINGR
MDALHFTTSKETRSKIRIVRYVICMSCLCIRTPGTGLYANLAKYDIPYPEAIFNINYFSDNPHPFFSLAKELTSMDSKNQAIMNGNVPICTFCAGAVKPNVVFFGEDLPEKYFQHAEDFPKADLLMIMGTSLKFGRFFLFLNMIIFIEI